MTRVPRPAGARGRGERRLCTDARRVPHRAGHPWRVVLPGLGPGLPDRRLRAGRRRGAGGGGHRGRLAPRGARRHGRAAARFGDGRVFLRAMAFGEDRENGTPLQVNDTRIGLGALGLDWGAPERGRGRVRLWGADAGLPPGLQRRLRRPLARGPHADAARARVALGSPPSGGASRVAPPGPGRASRRASSRARRKRPCTRAGRRPPRSRRGARRRAAPSSSRTSSRPTRGSSSRAPCASTRGPTATGASSRPRSRPPSPDHVVRRPAGDRPQPAPRARLPGLADALAPRLGLRGLPRPDPERALPLVPRRRHAHPREPRPRGGAAVGRRGGSARDAGPVSLRLTAFDAEVDGAVANVTVVSVPGLVTRQRRNVGRVRSRGLEAEGEWLVAARGVLTAGYALTDARVRSFPEDPGLEGLRLPQVPRHQVTFQARYGRARASRAGGSACRRGGRARPGRTTATSSSSARPSRSTSSPHGGSAAGSRSSRRRRTSSTPRSWWPAPRCRAWARRASSARECGCGLF